MSKKAKESKKNKPSNSSKSVKASRTSPAPDLSWFLNDRLGLFIHWGIYALPARHEWVRNREHITIEDYQKYFDHFDPDLYNPREWARAAKNAGMKYFVITTKHHDGFCLWDTKLTDYKATNTPWGKDLIRPMVEAFREEGLRVGLYHSIIDWHHPENRVDRIHPQANDPEYRKANQKRDQKKYIKYLHGQVKELLTDYGQIDYLFFDFSYPGEDGKGHEDWGSKDLIKMVRELQPKIIVNDRLDLMDKPGGWDIKTPEQFLVREPVTYNGKKVPWETCQTFSGSWGYHRDEQTWKSVKQLLTMLIDTVSKDGNLLLNVGPTARGNFDLRATERLAGMGEWMKVNARAIYGCGQAPEGFTQPEGCKLTYNASTNRMYVHIMNWGFKHLHLDGFGGKVEYAQFLHDGSEVNWTKQAGAWMSHQSGEETLTLNIPVQKPPVEIPVIELLMNR